MRIFLDGASLDAIKHYADDNLIQGFTTNPTLMAAEGVTNYESWAKEALSLTSKPISFEVLADGEPWADDAYELRRRVASTPKRMWDPLDNIWRWV
jgi:transaldolase